MGLSPKLELIYGSVQAMNQILIVTLKGIFAEFVPSKGRANYLIARYLEERKSNKRLFLFDAFESFPVESMGVTLEPN